jgi:predicted RNA binding protein YcfA (HicA-like mRNA interferase family)
MVLKVRDIVKLITKDGWYYIGSTGGHHHYKHPTKRGKVTVPGHSGDDVTGKTLKSILEQAGLK